VSIYKKSAIAPNPFAWIGRLDEEQNPDVDKDKGDFTNWLLNWDGITPPPNDLSIMKPFKPEKTDKYEGEGYMPSILF
jgi:hypothetical protein